MFSKATVASTYDTVILFSPVLVSKPGALFVLKKNFTTFESYPQLWFDVLNNWLHWSKELTSIDNKWYFPMHTAHVLLLLLRPRLCSTPARRYLLKAAHWCSSLPSWQSSTPSQRKKSGTHLPLSQAKEKKPHCSVGGSPMGSPSHVLWSLWSFIP